MTVGSQVKQTLAGLKGVGATLKIYATQSEEEEIKTVFTDATGITESVIKDLEERIKVLEFQEPQYKGH